MKETLHLLEYLALSLSLKGLRSLKRERAISIAKGLGELLYNYPRVKNVCRENLEFTGFPLKVGKESFKNFLACAVDFLKSPDYSFSYLKSLFYPLNLSSLPEEGGIFLTAHIGNWELMGALCSKLSGGRLSVVAKPMKNRKVDSLINSIRRGWGIKVIPTGRGVEVLRDLKRRRFVGILLDQRPKVSEGVLTKFLGRKTYTNKGVALISLKSGKPVIPAFCFIENGKYKVEIGEPIYPDGSVEELTQKYTSAIEEAVRKHPEQWFWFHRRWENSPEFKEWRSERFSKGR